MANLVTILPLISGGDTYAVPTPSKYTSNTATIVDSARNTDGKMIGTVIREDVAKIQMSWNFISYDDWASLVQQFSSKFGGAFIRNVTYFDQSSGQLETKQMYISDRNADSFLLFNEDTAPTASMIGLPMGYENATLSLIEV